MWRVGVLFGIFVGAGGAYFAIDLYPSSESWVVVGILGGITIIIYIIGRVAADAATKPDDSDAATKPGDSDAATKPGDSDAANFARVMLLGIGAGANAIAISQIYEGLLGATGAWVFAGAAAVILLLSVFLSISQSDVYQAFVGWLTWFLPMAWPVVALGAAAFVLGLFGALILGLPGVDYFKLRGLDVDWKTGTIFLKGTVVSNLNVEDTAFNMGNFSFVDAVSTDWHINHEAGHTLNLAAFGFLFHFVGALDEMVLGGGEKAFSERLAESNVPSSDRAGLSIPMWGPVVEAPGDPS